MEIKGTIVQVLPPQSGVSKAGNAWKKQEYILENNEGQFPRKICFTCFGQGCRYNTTAGGPAYYRVVRCRVARVQRPLVYRSSYVACRA